MNYPKTKGALLAFLLKKYRYPAFFAFCFTFTAVCINLYKTVLLKHFIDGLESYVSLFPYELCIYLGFAVLAEVAWRLSGIFGAHTIVPSKQEVMKSLSSYVVDHSVSFFDSRFSGSVAKRISSLSYSSIYILEASLWQVLPIFISFIFSLFIYFQLSLFLSIFFLCWFVFFLIGMFFFSRLIAKHSAETDTLESDLSGKIVDCLSNHKMVHAFAKYHYEKVIIADSSQLAKDAHFKQWYCSEITRVFSNVMVIMLSSVTLVSVLYLYQKLNLSIGSVIMCITLLAHFCGTLTHLSNVLNAFFHHIGVIDEGLKDLIIPHELSKGTECADAAFVPSVTIDSLSFSYGLKNVFNNFSLHIPAGQKVGIVGRSGSGKSTLVHLLKRQRDPQSGKIVIGNHSISELCDASLHSSITLISQENQLFNRSLRDNILYGRLDASEQELLDACDLAHAISFIERTENGLDSIVGERGLKLSGGEKQRINIARAVLANSPILILDEATSALDSESEKVIVSALDDLFVNRTVIAIAHRLSTLVSMDRIIVMDKGVIVEDGSHNELLAQRGLYYSLWTQQSEGFM